MMSDKKRIYDHTPIFVQQLFDLMIHQNREEVLESISNMMIYGMQAFYPSNQQLSDLLIAKTVKEKIDHLMHHLVINQSIIVANLCQAFMKHTSINSYLNFNFINTYFTKMYLGNSSKASPINSNSLHDFYERYIKIIDSPVNTPNTPINNDKPCVKSSPVNSNKSGINFMVYFMLAIYYFLLVLKEQSTPPLKQEQSPELLLTIVLKQFMDTKLSETASKNKLADIKFIDQKYTKYLSLLYKKHNKKCKDPNNRNLYLIKYSLHDTVVLLNNYDIMSNILKLACWLKIKKIQQLGSQVFTIKDLTNLITRFFIGFYIDFIPTKQYDNVSYDIKQTNFYFNQMTYFKPNKQPDDTPSTHDVSTDISIKNLISL